MRKFKIHYYRYVGGKMQKNHIIYMRKKMKAKDIVGACTLHDCGVTRGVFTKKKCFQCLYYGAIEQTKIKNSLRRINYIECFDWKRAKQQVLFQILEPFKRSVMKPTERQTKKVRVGASFTPGQKQI